MFFHRISKQHLTLAFLLALLSALAPIQTSAVGSQYPNALFAIPTDGTIIRQVGWYGSEYHTGIDISGASSKNRGPAVYAAFPGTIIYVGRDPGDASNIPSHIVIIDHGWININQAYTMSMYVHMGQNPTINTSATSYINPAITVGTVVRMGTYLGNQGCAGSCTGTHLHFEVRQRATPWTAGSNISNYWGTRENVRQPGDFIFGKLIANNTSVRYNWLLPEQNQMALVEIVAQHSGKCLEIGGSTTANGGLANQWDCIGATNQRWGLRPAGDGFEVVAQHSNKCLEIGGSTTANGGLANQWDCIGATNQRWRIKRIGGSYELHPVHDDKCLDVEAQSKNNGARLMQWDCLGGANQRYLLRPLGRYEVTAQHSGKCLEIGGSTTANGGLANQWDCVRATNQRWSFRPAGDGFEVIVQHSGKCLEIGGSTTANGGLANQWDCVGAANQRWYLNPVGGSFELIAVHSSKCADVEGQSVTNGVRLIQWDCWSGANQRWLLRTP